MRETVMSGQSILPVDSIPPWPDSANRGQVDVQWRYEQPVESMGLGWRDKARRWQQPMAMIVHDMPRATGEAALIWSRADVAPTVGRTLMPGATTCRPLGSDTLPIAFFGRR